MARARSPAAERAANRGGARNFKPVYSFAGGWVALSAAGTDCFSPAGKAEVMWGAWRQRMKGARQEKRRQNIPVRLNCQYFICRLQSGERTKRAGEKNFRREYKRFIR
jgi:hypothetical protein